MGKVSKKVNAYHTNFNKVMNAPSRNADENIRRHHENEKKREMGKALADEAKAKLEIKNAGEGAE